jgi:hypothetical protein
MSELTSVTDDNILERAYAIIKKQSETNMLLLPAWKAVACAYLMGLDHGYTAHEQENEKLLEVKE